MHNAADAPALSCLLSVAVRSTILGLTTQPREEEGSCARESRSLVGPICFLRSTKCVEEIDRTRLDGFTPYRAFSHVASNFWEGRSLRR